MKRIIPILIAILICFGVGCTASYFQSESILNWYPALEKPAHPINQGENSLIL